MILSAAVRHLSIGTCYLWTSVSYVRLDEVVASHFFRDFSLDLSVVSPICWLPIVCPTELVTAVAVAVVVACVSWKAMFHRNHDEKRLMFYKSTNLAIFVLFGINKEDAASLLSMLERVDLEFTQDLDVAEFAEKFCGEYKDLLLYLWRRYYRGYELTMVRREDQDKARALSEIPEELLEEEVDPGIYLTSYLNFLGFLLMFLHVRDKDICHWLYWLMFQLPQIPPDHDKMSKLVDTFWNERPVVAIQAKRARLSADLVLRNVEKIDFCPNQLSIMDSKATGAWSNPLLSLRRVIVRSTLGHRIWNRVNHAVERACENIVESYQILRDTDSHNKYVAHQKSDKKNFILYGERKIARKEIRQYVRVFKTYKKMPLNTFDDPDDDEEEAKDSLAASLIGFVGKQMRRNSSGQPSKDGLGIGKPWLPKIGMFLKKKEVSTDENHDDEEHIIPLEIKYKDSLTEPMKSIYIRCASAQEKAKIAMKECEEALVANFSRKTERSPEQPLLSLEYSGNSSRSSSRSWSGSDSYSSALPQKREQELVVANAEEEELSSEEEDSDNDSKIY